MQASHWKLVIPSVYLHSIMLIIKSLKLCSGRSNLLLCALCLIVLIFWVSFLCCLIIFSCLLLGLLCFFLVKKHNWSSNNFLGLYWIQFFVGFAWTNLIKYFQSGGSFKWLTNGTDSADWHLSCKGNILVMRRESTTLHIYNTFFNNAVS